MWHYDNEHKTDAHDIWELGPNIDLKYGKALSIVQGGHTKDPNL